MSDNNNINSNNGDTVVEEAPTNLKEVLQELPEDLVKNLPTIVSRLNSFITFYSTVNLKRLDKLTRFVIKAEEVLFDDDHILDTDNDTLKENYKQAKNATLEILDLARKVSMQISQEEAANKEVDEVYKLLKSLSPETIESIKENLVSLKSTEE